MGQKGGLVFGVPWRARVVAIAVLVPDSPVGAVDNDLTLLPLRDSAGGIDRVGLGGMG